MKKLYCKDYDFECCESCHRDDEMFTNLYRGFVIIACCISQYYIMKDIDKNLEEGLENDCQ